MATKKKMLQAAAGTAAAGGGAGLDITDVFSTYLYEGTGSALTITNGIDLDGEGGLVWTKSRSSNDNHGLVDTERGRTVYLRSNTTQSNRTTNGPSYDLTSFNSNGFSLGPNWELYGNNNGDTYASWTFRKAPKFFTCLTYTGDGVSGRQISHNLGSKPGFIIVKRTDTGNNPYNYWRTAHIDGTTLTAMDLNTTSDASSSPWFLWSDSATGTSAYAAAQQTDSYFTVGNNASVNGSGGSFVAYLFAHNDGDGEFGPDGDADIIKCGSYTGNGSTTGPVIDLGFEPQWLMVKRADASGESWYLFDVMRGMPNGGNTADIYANASAAEDTYLGSSNDVCHPTSSGFSINTNSTALNASGGTYIYMAIRRGPLAVPEDATEVFAIDTRSDATSNPPSYSANGIVDMALQKELNASGWGLWDRIRGQYRLQTHANNAEDGPFSYANFDHMDGWADIGATDTTHSWMWKRAPGFFDVVAYTGNGTAGRTVSHNLGVAPEMMWVKSRSAAYNWYVYHTGIGTSAIRLNLTGGIIGGEWQNTVPTEDVFTLGNGFVNLSSVTYIAYLFASAPGVSKVGSYTGNGTSQNIDCGFTAGARFVITKRTDADGDWYVWDTARGIVAGDDARLLLNDTQAEGSADRIDPYSGGFAVTSANDQTNGDGASYIFYAIA